MMEAVAPRNRIASSGHSNREVYHFLKAIKDSSRYFLGVSPASTSQEEAETLHKVCEHNRSCGDSIELHLRRGLKNQDMRLGYAGYFCAVCHASAEIMSGFVNETKIASLQGLEALPEIETVKRQMIDLESPSSREAFKSSESFGQESLKMLGLLIESLEPFALRFQCASLPWKALESLIKQESTVGVKTK